MRVVMLDGEKRYVDERTVEVWTNGARGAVESGNTWIAGRHVRWLAALADDEQGRLLAEAWKMFGSGKMDKDGFLSVLSEVKITT